MVDPVSQAERDSFTRKLKVGVAALVAVSTVMVALSVGATLPQALAALVAGVVVGGVIAWYAVPSAPAPAERRASSRLDDPFADGGDEAESETRESRRASASSRDRE